jgi:hypothetical protein
MLRKKLDPAERRGHCVAALTRLGTTGEGGPSTSCLPTAEELASAQLQTEDSRRVVQPLVVGAVHVGSSCPIARESRLVSQSLHL